MFRLFSLAGRRPAPQARKSLTGGAGASLRPAIFGTGRIPPQTATLLLVTPPNVYGWNTRTLVSAGIACLLASLAVWEGFAIWQEHAGEERANHLLAAEGSVEVQLFKSDTATRAAFLRTSLESASSVEKLDGREQSFSVALSQVRSSEARAMFQQAILLAISGSPLPDAKTLHECFIFMRKWSAVDGMSVSERESLASDLVAAILRIRDSDQIDVLATGLSMLAPGIGTAKADDLASRLVGQSVTVTGLIALAEKLSPNKASELAVNMTDHMIQNRDEKELRGSALGVKSLESKVSEAAAEEIAGKVVARMMAELNPAVLGPLASDVSPLKGKIAAAKAGELASQLAQRMILERDAGDLDALLSAWTALSGSVEPAKAGQLASIVAPAMITLAPDAYTFNRLSAALGVLKDTPHSGLYESLGASLIARMKNEPEPSALAEFASSAAILKDKLAQEKVEEAAGILVKRIAGERNPAVIAPLASALDDLDEGIGKDKAAQFASTLGARMSAEPDGSSLLSLAVGFIAVAQRVEAEQTDHAQVERLAAPLLSQIQQEDRAGVLRTLAFSVGALAGSLNPAELQKAEAHLAMAMRGELDSDDLRALVAGLLQLKGKAGEESYKKAASILVSRIKIESQPLTLRSLVSSLHALGPHVEDSYFNEAASILIARILNVGTDGAKRAAKVQALARSLAVIEPNLGAGGAAKAALMLVARIQMEPDPDMLRAYGEALGSLPLGSLTAAQIDSVAGLFKIPDAPCEVATRAGDGNAGRLVTEILNPLCSEHGWMQAVVALGALTKQSIIHGKESDTSESSADADFTKLIADDDDDAGSGGGEGEGIEVDFNKLSQVVAGLRPGESISLWPIAVHTVSGLVLLCGLLLLHLAWRGRTSERG